MAYEDLIKRRIIEPCTVSKGELAEHLRVAKHDASVAQDITSIDLDWAFTVAYNGILQTALSYMYFQGYRPRGEGKHLNTFRFLKVALPESYENEINRLQKLRRKRNMAVYQKRGTVTEREAMDIIKFAEKFFEEILNLMPKEYKKLLKEVAE